MPQPNLSGIAPREMISFLPPGGMFRKSDYPWLAAVRVTLKGGDGGAGPTGEPGDAGETKSQVILAVDLPDDVPVTVGAGGKGAAPGTDGENGYVLVELFDLTQ